MFKKVILSVDNIDISGQLYLPAGKGPYPTVCVCHGIPDRVSSPNDKDYSLLAEKFRQKVLPRLSSTSGEPGPAAATLISWGGPGT